VQDFDLRAWAYALRSASITAQLAVSGNDTGFSAHGPVNPPHYTPGCSRRSSPAATPIAC